jgi:hypothetical protein
MSEQGMKPIWYFVGLIILVIGVLVFCSGIYIYFNPPVVTTVLAETHPNLWWGGLMMIFGGGLYFKMRKQTR